MVQRKRTRRVAAAPWRVPGGLGLPRATGCICCDKPATCQIQPPSGPGHREPPWLPCCDSVDCETVLRSGVVYFEADEQLSLGVQIVDPTPMSDPRLATLREEPGGLRFYLDEQSIHAGDVIEIETGGGWRLVRFEWSGRRLDDVTLYERGDNPAFWFQSSMFQRVAIRWPRTRP